jgi:hypothetical protein
MTARLVLVIGDLFIPDRAPVSLDLIPPVPPRLSPYCVVPLTTA